MLEMDEFRNCQEKVESAYHQCLILWVSIRNAELPNVSTEEHAAMQVKIYNKPPRYSKSPAFVPYVVHHKKGPI